jgi:hypothetical protein
MEEEEEKSSYGPIKVALVLQIILTHGLHFTGFATH